MRTAAALLLAIALASPAQAATDGIWQGTLHCDIIPGILTKPLVQPFEIDIRAGVARYQRNVRMPDTTAASGFQEQGEGKVDAAGNLTLRGHGLAQTATYDAEYTGTLTGSPVILTGLQHWRFARHAPYDRRCDITLRQAAP